MRIQSDAGDSKGSDTGSGSGSTADSPERVCVALNWQFNLWNLVLWSMLTHGIEVGLFCRVVLISMLTL